MPAGPQTPAAAAWDAVWRAPWPEIADAVIEQWREPLFLVDRRTVVQHANRPGRQWLQRQGTGEDPPGGPLFPALAVDGPSAMRLAGAVAAGREDALVAAGREGTDLAITVNPLRLGGQPAGAVVVVRDPTAAEQRIADQVRGQRMASLARLAAGAAHEIRNPLTAIRGFLQLLQSECREGTAVRYVEIVSQEIRRIEGITADLLLLSRAPAADLRPCELGALLRDTCDLLRASAADRGARLELAVQPGTPACLAVPERLQQVFLNLVGNAIEAMPHGGTVRVAVRQATGRTDGGAGLVEVEVEDEGPGIPPDVLPRVFDPFFTTKAGGTGLGLAVSDSIVLGLGGRIAVESPPGDGAKFTVRLPALTSVGHG